LLVLEPSEISPLLRILVGGERSLSMVLEIIHTRKSSGAENMLMHIKRLNKLLRGRKFWIPGVRPLRILILTSVRDVGKCDLNGSTIPTMYGQKYMMGLLEYIIHESKPGGKLYGVVEVAAVVTDDLPKDLVDSPYSVEPALGEQWIHPLSLEFKGQRITTITQNIPSTFRQETKPRTKERSEAKREFEAKVLEVMKWSDADIILSDHYMCIIEHMINGFGFYGRVLNIHPAITLLKHRCCFRGATPTADALKRAWDRAEKDGVEDIVTGATLHLVNEEEDDGPVVYWSDATEVLSRYTPAELRLHNYRTKFRVFENGIKIYTHEHYNKYC
jgi:folate-dependent phosphoribosylglycinamide formyltransferase PurN